MERKFETILSDRFSRVEQINQTEVRWWMAAGVHTDETILEELNAMHAAGFSGVELCQLADRTVNAELYGYGTEQWEHDVKLILNTALDLGMSVSLTSGAGWSTANVPGLDPDSQAANQCVVLLTEDLAAEQSRSGALPTDSKLREKAVFLGAVALPKAGEKIYAADRGLILTELVKNGELDWTAPAGDDYTIMYYFVQGTAQAASPARETSYTINYFDRRGFDALKDYLEENVLNDEEIKARIKAGNVQFFMDSLEFHSGKGITNWSEAFAEEFCARKGYDVLPYLFLTHHAPNTSIWGWSDNADLQGEYSLPDAGETKRVLDDIFDVQTKLYLEQFMTPFRAWLNAQGIKLRAQISYGKNLEISEPIATVDYPEAENRNQNNQVDMYRLWSGGAHLQNKVLSSETGGLNDSAYNYTYQRHLQEAYALYAAGYSRMIWHIWSAIYGPTPVWPGYEGGDGKHIFYKFGTREPSFSEYCEFNEHLGRVQKLLRTGKAAVDLGMIYMKYGQHLVYTDAKDWMHTHQPMFFPSAVLQDKGYTYDYFTPDLLNAEGVFFNKETGVLEGAGYKALILWHGDLSVRGAERVLELAREGLPVVMVEGAASASPYRSDDENALRRLTDELRALDNVCTVPSADAVIDALRTLGIDPYVGFSCPNQQLLSQTRRDGKDRYLYLYNYCDGALHDDACAPHGDVITAELVADGIFVPYVIDSWTGKVTKSASYRHDNGKTRFDVTLEYGDVALYGLEAVEEAPLHAIDGAPVVERDGKLFRRFLQSGDGAVSLSDGTVASVKATVDAPVELTDWTLRVDAVVPTDEVLTRTETLLGVTTSEYACKTETQTINVDLARLKPWSEIDGIGNAVSGKGYYRATFSWQGGAQGAILEFGSVVQSMQVRVNGVKTDPVNMNRPRVDISTLLRTGENVIEVDYSSNLNNLQLSRGMIREGVLPSNFLGYETKYQPYGLQSATVIFYEEIEVCKA